MNESDVSRSLQSWVSTIQSVVLTADIFQFLIKSDCEMLQTSCVSLYEDLTQRSFFLRALWSVIRYLGNLDLLRPKIYSAEKERKPTPEVTSRRRHAHVCKISRSLKIGVDI